MANLTITNMTETTIFRQPATPDTGCTHTMISRDIANKYKLYKCNTHTTKKLPSMRAANDTKLNITGKLRLLITAPPAKEPTDLEILICDDMQDEMLLAWSDCITMGIIPKNFPQASCKVSRASTAKTEEEEIAEVITELIQEFDDVISDLLSKKPLKGEPMKLHFRDDIEIVPKRVSRARQTPAHLEQPADEALEELIKQASSRE